VVESEAARRSVLLVDDEPQILEVLEAYLRRDGFDTAVAGNVAQALEALAAQPPDVMILDVTLPDGSGFDVLRAATSEEGRLPTIMLTARSDEADRIVGLELGADDYIVKPFSAREVVARVRALLRRVDERGSARPKPGHVLQVGNLEVDFEFHEARIGGKAVKLTAAEFRLLNILAASPGEVFTRAHLLDRMEDGGGIYEQTLDRHINNLRKKLEPDPRNPVYVTTVYGVGYRMARDV
jgi:two-component system alkaline phosphatase synthesis response regulator PhoP